jgi:hypothetical protein
MVITIVSAPPILGLTYPANKFSDLLRQPPRPYLWGLQYDFVDLMPCRAGGFSSCKLTNHIPRQEATTDTRYTLLEKQRAELLRTEYLSSLFLFCWYW